MEITTFSLELIFLTHHNYKIAPINFILYPILCESFTNSLGPGLDLYAHNLGEDNSTDVG